MPLAAPIPDAAPTDPLATTVAAALVIVPLNVAVSAPSTKSALVAVNVAKVSVCGLLSTVSD
jgi:hypothetical protein